MNATLDAQRKRPGLSLSHFGLYVTDLERMADFYTRVLGFTVTDRGLLPTPDGGTVELIFTSRDPAVHHQIVLAAGRPAQQGFNPINQISLEADSLVTLRGFYARFLAEHVDDVQPVTHGNAISVYARDPEGNRVELFIDTPWYVTQPMRVPVDFSQPDDALMAAVEAHARTLPGFCPRAQWEQAMAKRMGVAV